MSWFRFVGWIGGLLWCWGCAQQVPPTGGPRDERPPQLDTVHSTPNYQTLFRKQPIVLVFDEWIKLNDPLNQVVVSPPLAYPPQIKLRKKTVIFDFDEREQLRPNATYTIHFGEAIQDMTEGNVAPVRFLFATGPYIDSLKVMGQVVDAWTGEPVEGVRLMLYDNLDDSAIYTQRPFYFGTTDAQGHVRIENVRPDTFKVVALADANRNYLYDRGERIAFASEPIVIRDSVGMIAPLRMFVEEEPLRLLDEEVLHYGLVRLTFNRRPWDVRLGWDTSEVDGWSLSVQDSILFWHVPKTPSFTLYIHQTGRIDTLQIAVPERTTLGQKSPLAPIQPLPPSQALPPDTAWVWVFNHPLAALDTAKVQLSDTTGNRLAVQWQIDGPARRQLQLKPLKGWRAEMPYRLSLYAGALTDVFGLVLADTLQQNLRVRSRDEFGALHLRLRLPDVQMPYVVQLYRGSDQLVEAFSVQAGSLWVHRWPLLKPAKYQLVVIADRNDDGRWTTGRYPDRQPEDVFVHQLEEIRPNWEVEAELDLSFPSVH